MSNSGNRLEFASAGIVPVATITDWFNEVDQALAKYGFAPGVDSRVLRARHVVKVLSDNGAVLGQLSNGEVLAALQDAYQWRAIFRVAARRAPDPLFKGKLKDALKVYKNTSAFGPDEGRDAQFELFTWASLKDETQPRLQCKFDGSPDILLSDPNGELAIEVKRVTSSKKFLKRLSDARAQVERRDLLGGVATDVTAFVDHNWPPPAATLDEAGKLLGRNLRDVMLEKRYDFRDPGPLKVWSAHVCRFYDVGGKLAGPLGCWGHVPIGDGTKTDEDRPMNAFAHPGSYSFFEPE